MKQKNLAMLLPPLLAIYSCTPFSNIEMQPEKGEVQESQNSSNNGEQQTAEDYRSLGDSAMHENPERSIKFFEKALELKPDDIISLYHMGESYNLLQDYKKAEQIHKRAVAINPKNPDSWRHLAQTYDECFRFDDAAECWRKVIDLTLGGDEESDRLIRDLYEISAKEYGSGTHIFLVQSLKKGGRIADALAAADEGMAKTNDPLLYVIRADIFTDLGRYEEALKDYETLMKQNPIIWELNKSTIQSLEDKLKSTSGK